MLGRSRMDERRFQIDEKSRPDLPGMMLVVSEALKDLGGSATIQELDEKVIEVEGVTEAEQAFTMAGNDGRIRVNYYLAWARTYLKRGDALVNSSRGVWALTESGAAITTLDKTSAIHEQVAREERERARNIRHAVNELEKTGFSVDLGLGEDKPKDESENEPEDAEEWRSLLLAKLGEMPSDAFERLSQRFLREAGFTKVEVRGEIW